MPWYPSDMSSRQEITDALQALEHLSKRQIVAALAVQGVTTITGRPWTIPTLYGYLNPLRQREQARLRNHRVREARARSTHTREEWAAILIRAGGRCEVCGRAVERLTKDHRVPLYAGGDDAATNLRAACRRCNSSRGAKDAPWPTLVQRLRHRLDENVLAFGARFARSGRSVEDWEQGRRQPDRAVRQLLQQLALDVGL